MRPRSYHVSAYGLTSTLNDHADRGWFATCHALLVEEQATRQVARHLAPRGRGGKIFDQCDKPLTPEQWIMERALLVDAEAVDVTPKEEK
jgi:hypothetical protein